MNFLKKIAYCLAFVLFLSACGNSNSNSDGVLTIKFDKTKRIELDGQEFKIKFVQLVKETRCAPGMECVWEGEVAVRIIINDEKDAIIGFHYDYPTVTTYKNHTFELLGVSYNKNVNFGKEKYSQIRLHVE